MTGYIYCHISPSGKKYIGQTTTSLQHRFNNGENYSSSPVFWKAIQKYGWDNFSHIILDVIESENKEELIDLLNKKERERILEFNSVVPNGYNIELGGGQGRVTTEKRKVISSTLLGYKTPSKEILENLYLKENKTMEDISKILNISRNAVSKWLKWYDIPINYSHRDTKQINIEEFKYYYIVLNHTQKECSEHFEIPIGYIPTLIKKYDLYKRRKKNENSYTKSL